MDRTIDHDHSGENVQIRMTNDQDEPKRLGMLLVGHGTRDTRGVAESHNAAAMVSELVPDVVVEAAFLELTGPTIDDAMHCLAQRPVDRIVVVPMLLFAAGHAKKDIPEQVARSSASFPHINICISEPLDCHDEVLAASAERFLEATNNQSGDLSLVIVSRGTSDPDAIERVRRFVEERSQLTPTTEVHFGFMAIAKPSITAVLDAALSSPCQTIVVQPHLLFHGRVFLDLQDQIGEARKRCPDKQIILTQYLGPSAYIARAVTDRFRDGLSAWQLRD